MVTTKAILSSSTFDGIGHRTVGGKYSNSDMAVCHLWFMVHDEWFMAIMVHGSWFKVNGSNLTLMEN